MTAKLAKHWPFPPQPEAPAKPAVTEFDRARQRYATLAKSMKRQRERKAARV